MIYTVNEMKRFVDEYGLSYGEISEKSGVPISTVQKIFGGLVKKPRKSTLESLSKVFIYYNIVNMNKCLKKMEKVVGDILNFYQWRKFPQA